VTRRRRSGLVLYALAWVLWAEESQLAPATTDRSIWRLVAGADTREDCESLGRHQADSVPKARAYEVVVTPIGERAVIWAQSTPRLMKLVVFQCLPESADPRPK
jgi:hypothetical protein